MKSPTTPGAAMQTTRCFTAFKVERDGKMRPVVFPADIQILVMRTAHKLSDIDTAEYVAFSPLSGSIVYVMAETEFHECTKLND